MGGRHPKLKQSAIAALARIGANPGTELRKRIAHTIRDLAAEADLPTARDYESMLPPVRCAWVRYVKNANAWVYFTFNDEAVIIETVVTSPPVPVFENDDDE